MLKEVFWIWVSYELVKSCYINSLYLYQALKFPKSSFNSAINTVCVLSCFSHIRICETTWTVARQAPLSMGILQARILEGLPCPPPGDLPDPAIQAVSLKLPALAGGFLATGVVWKYCAAIINSVFKGKATNIQNFLRKFFCSFENVADFRKCGIHCTSISSSACQAPGGEQVYSVSFERPSREYVSFASFLWWW